MTRVRWRHLVAMGITAAVLVLAACSASGAASGSTVVKTKPVSLNGTNTTVLADASGHTLYYFMPDTATTVACTGDCASLGRHCCSPRATRPVATVCPAR